MVIRNQFGAVRTDSRWWWCSKTSKRRTEHRTDDHVHCIEGAIWQLPELHNPTSDRLKEGTGCVRETKIEIPLTHEHDKSSLRTKTSTSMSSPPDVPDKGIARAGPVCRVVIAFLNLVCVSIRQKP